MITIDIDAMALKAIDRKLEDMQQAISDLQHTDLASELGEWETQDTSEAGVREASTQWWIDGHPAALVVRNKGTAQGRASIDSEGQIRSGWSTRPILRPALLDRLVERAAMVISARQNQGGGGRCQKFGTASARGAPAMHVRYVFTI